MNNKFGFLPISLNVTIKKGLPLISLWLQKSLFLEKLSFYLRPRGNPRGNTLRQKSKYIFNHFEFLQYFLKNLETN